MSKLLTPTTHLNGTSRDDLLKQHIDILDPCRGLLTALRAGTPNARDYYPQGETAATEARNAYNVRYAFVSQIFDDFEEVAIEITREN